jgi:hypothetical protein
MSSHPSLRLAAVAVVAHDVYDHYLLGAPRPAWMDTPVPYLVRGTREVTTFFGKPGEAATAPSLGATRP